jgi:hypothetical protein
MILFAIHLLTLKYWELLMHWRRGGGNWARRKENSKVSGNEAVTLVKCILKPALRLLSNMNFQWIF